MAFGHQHGRVARHAASPAARVVAALSGIAGGVDALTGFGSLFFGQHGQRLPRRRQRRAVARDAPSLTRARRPGVLSDGVRPPWSTAPSGDNIDTIVRLEGDHHVAPLLCRRGYARTPGIVASGNRTDGRT